MSKKKLHNTELQLKKILIATNHEKLVDILLSLRSSNSNIQKQLDIIFAGLDKDPKKIAIMIKKEIVLLKKSSKFVDYYESDALVDRLNDLYLRIINDLKDKSPEIAFEMMLDFLDLHKNTLERVEDSKGRVSEIFCTACNKLHSISRDTDHLNNQALVEIIFTRFMDNDYGIYDDIIHSFKDILKDQDFHLLKEKFKNVVNNKNTEVVKSGLKSIADCKNNVDEYISACAFNSDIYTYDYLEIAKRLIKHLRPKEAIEWLDHMKIPMDHPWNQHKKDLKIQALELDGNYEQVQKERLSWFSETLNPKLYDEILKAAKPDFKNIFISDAINKAFQFQEPHTGLGFLVLIKEFEKLAKFVHARCNELNGRQFYILRLAADFLQKTDPIAATLLYRKMIDVVLNEAKSKYYDHAAKDLEKCGTLDSKIEYWGALESHREYLKSIEIKHKKKISFWFEYTSVLQKKY